MRVTNKQLLYRILLFSLVICLVALTGWVVPRVKAADVPGEPDTQLESPESVTTTEELTQQWIDSLNSDDGNWLYVSYQLELGGDPGVDPSVGWPLPMLSQWEIWYQLDDQGQIMVMLTRRSDLERDHVWLSAWNDGRVLRQPSGETEEDFPLQSGHPISFLTCLSVIEDALERGVTVDNQWVAADQSTQYQVVVQLTHDPITDLSGYPEASYIGVETTCLQADSGSMVSVERYLLTSESGEIFGGRMDSFIAYYTPEPPSELMAVLNQLQ